MLLSFSTKTDDYHVLEFCSQGTLQSLISSRHRSVLSENELRGTIKCLVEALLYLRKELVLHRDIKPSNVLIAENGRVVSSSCQIYHFEKLFRMIFRNCRILVWRHGSRLCIQRLRRSVVHQITSHRKLIFFSQHGRAWTTLLFSEVISRIPYSFPIDLWSLGCLIITCLSGVPPFDASSSFVATY